MFKESDFKIDTKNFHFKKDSYPLAKITNAKFKRMSLLDNLGQLIFWLALFSGSAWLVVNQFSPAPSWLIGIAVSLSVVGFLFSLSRCSRYALQVEFKHIDETGTQWINVAKSYSSGDGQLLEKQVECLKKVIG